MDLLWLAEAILLGILLAYRWSGLAAVQPFPARVLLLGGAGAAGGIGAAAVLYFLAGDLVGQPLIAMAVELALLAWTAWECWRHRPAPAPASAAEPRSALSMALWGALLLAVVLATVAISAGWEAVPHGNWDAWSIWNLRARFLASPPFASGAWSPVIAPYTHAEYPLLLSSFVARCWAFGHSSSAVLPAATSYVFFLSLLALVCGGIVMLRGAALGVLAALILAATPSLLREVPAQYADVPLACYMAGAVVLALLDRFWMAGIFASFAAWTKDEGLLFLAVFLLFTAILKRRGIVAAVLGAAPVAALDLIFKAWLPKGTTSLLSSSAPGAAHRALDAGRFGAVLSAFAHEFAGMGLSWYHPLIPLAIVAIALRFDRRRRLDLLYALGVCAAVLAGDFAVYLLTSNDLQWQLQTSLPRILMQAWPLLVVAAFAGINLLPAATNLKPAKAPARKSERRRP